MAPPLRDLLLRQQMAGQAATYDERYPDARSDIVEHDGVPIGRMVVERTDTAVILVDIALLSEWQGRGVGTHLLRGLIETAETAGCPLRLSVDRGNHGARRLYERLGFVATGAGVTSMTLERPAARAF